MPGGTVAYAQLDSARISMVTEARAIYVSNLSNYEKEISNVANNINFKITTTIAVVALIVSMLGAAV